MCWEKVSVRLSQNLYIHYPFFRNPYIGWLDQDKYFEKRKYHVMKPKILLNLSTLLSTLLLSKLLLTLLLSTYNILQICYLKSPLSFLHLIDVHLILFRTLRRCRHVDRFRLLESFASRHYFRPSKVTSGCGSTSDCYGYCWHFN